MARIVVSGYMVRHPVAGMLMVYFHYVLGLHRLGHEVVYLEESGWPQSCYHPTTREHSDDPGEGLNIVRTTMARYGMAGVPVAYIHRDSGRVEGMEWDEVKRVLDAADLLLNVGGVCWLPAFRRCRRRVLVDLDPFFMQIGEFGAGGLDDYHHYFTCGTNINRPECDIPTGDKDWRPTVPPVVPDIWPHLSSGGDAGTSGEEDGAAFTTIANWRAYGGITYEGRHYGQKGEEFLRLLHLPSRVSQRLELALSNASPDVQRRLTAAGWSVSDGGAVSGELSTYQRFIAGSRGEFSVAKNAYVKTRSGWFSDRSVCYLAAGRPVVLQDTGFSDWLPTGRGVLAFSSLGEAATRIEEVDAYYSAHRRAAKRIAEQVFSYDVVLPRLVDTALGAGTVHSVPFESSSAS